MAREYDRIKLSLELRKELSKLSTAYRACMQTIYQWQGKYKADAPKEFKEGVHAMTHEARRVNECRSTTKEYWRVAFMAMELSPASSNHDAWKRELKSRHDHFTAGVKPLDVLDGYDNADMAVYNFPG